MSTEELTTEQLEADGDHAADYVESLLDIADLDGDIDIDVRGGRAYVSVTGGGTDLEVLATPDAVQAVQDLARLAVQARTGRFTRLVVDIGGSREARETELKKIVDAAIAQLSAGLERIELEPMSSYERKLVHDQVAERGYHSESHGEGRSRRLVITRAG